MQSFFCPSSRYVIQLFPVLVNHDVMFHNATISQHFSLDSKINNTATTHSFRRINKIICNKYIFYYSMIKCMLFPTGLDKDCGLPPATLLIPFFCFLHSFHTHPFILVLWQFKDIIYQIKYYSNTVITKQMMLIFLFRQLFQCHLENTTRI